jgi:phosphatidylserine/phosphatidylglycerophosphate/cardiolipin synthase-like enzyme
MTAKLVLNEEYLPELLKLLKTAKKQIDILSYSFAIGSAAGKLATTGAPFQIAHLLKELKEKHGKKLRIRLYIEGTRDTSERNKVTADYLSAAGVEVVFGATHAKGFCIDKKFVLFGSTNLTNQSIVKNNEANVLFSDPKLAKGFTKYFDHLWEGGLHGEVSLPAPYLADGEFKDELLALIENAKKRIEFSIYFFNHREIEKALVQANSRGVDIRGFIHQHASFALPYIRANRATVKRLRAHGIDEIYFSVPTKFSHSKYLVADRKVLMLGTGNWLVQDVEIHPQLYVKLEDPKLSKALVKHLDYQIKTQSTED